MSSGRQSPLTASACPASPFSALIAPSPARAASSAAAAAIGAGLDAADREDREHAVADELQHLAAIVADSLHQPLEIGIQDADHLGAGEAVGEAGVVAHVGDPDDGVDHLARAAPDLAGEHAPAAPLAEIGGEHVLRDAAEREEIEIERNRRDELLQRRQIVVPKAALGARCDGHGAVEASRMRDREGPVIREALARERSHHRNVGRSLRVLRVVADRDAVVDDGPERAQEEIARLAHMHIDPKLVAGPALRIPIGGEAEHLRVQRADVEARTIEGEACGDEPRHQSVEKLGEPGGAGVARHEPVLRRAVDLSGIGNRDFPNELHVRRIIRPAQGGGLEAGSGQGLGKGHLNFGLRTGLLNGHFAFPLPEGHQAALAALARLARLRSFGSRMFLRSRIDFGVTSTSSSSAM